MNLEEIKRLENEFLENVDLYYFNILFSVESQLNEKITILQRPKPVFRKGVELNPQSLQKEIIIEITGMNSLLENKDPFNDQFA